METWKIFFNIYGLIKKNSWKPEDTFRILMIGIWLRILFFFIFLVEVIYYFFFGTVLFFITVAPVCC